LSNLNIIIDTDWLRKYDRVILCANRAIQLTREDGATVEFVATIFDN
jgi:hypothetical protein